MGEIQQNSFTTGEISQSAYGRTDMARYASGLRRCQNFIVRPHGGVVNRPGFHYVADLGQAVRLVPFQYSTVQTYVLAFGNYAMWVFSNGGQVVYPVGHPSAGQPVQINTPYSSAMLSMMKWTQNADVMTLCCSDMKPQQLSRYDHHDWRFADFANAGGPFLDINVDTTKTIQASGAVGNVTITSTVDIFTADMVGRLFYIEQSPDATTKKWEVQKGIVINDIRRAGVNYYKAVAGGTTGTVKPDHVEGTAYDGDPGVPWLYLHSGSGIVKITSFITSKSVMATVINRLPDLVVSATPPKTINALTPGNGSTVQVRVTINAHGYANGAAVTIQGVTGTTGANGTFQVVVIDANSFFLSGCYDNAAYTGGGICTAALQATPTYKWALEAWGGEQKFPGATSYYQQRQVFASTSLRPESFWMSRVKGYQDFGQETPILDDDAVSFTVASREVNQIRHVVELSDLLLLTSSGSWVVKGSQDGVLTPSSVNVKRQGNIGSSHVPPVVIDSSVLFLTEKGSQLRSLGYSFQSDAFVGQDLTILASHLFQDLDIKAMAFQRVPYSCIWCVRSDGTLLGFTYMPDQEVAGWHRHTTDGLFKDVCVVSEGDEDAVYVYVTRTVNGNTRHYLERLDSRNYPTAAGIFLDSSLSYVGAPVTYVTGLSHLEGKTVSIVGDGDPQGTGVVSGGRVDLPGSFWIVHVGLPIVAEIETLDLTAGPESIRDRRKISPRISLLMDESEEILVGPDASQLERWSNPDYIGYDPNTYQAEPHLVTVNVPSGWEKSCRITVRQDKPLPVTILALYTEIKVGGS